MTFYIPEFWIGVFATILVEFIGVIILGISNTLKNKKNKGDRK